MRHPFSDLEGLRIAVEMEKRGAEFYRYGEKIATRPKAAALLGQLRADEQRHQAEFQELADSIDAQSEGASAAYDPESSAYLSAVAADIVYPEGLVAMARGDGLDNPVSILRGAIQAEKDSILFYTEIEARARDGRARRVFAQIAQQEKEHLSRLQAMLLEELS